jgi:hypothetical protein
MRDEFLFGVIFAVCFLAIAGCLIGLALEVGDIHVG